MAAIRVLAAIIEMGVFRLFFYHIVSCGQIMCQLCVFYYWDVGGFLFLVLVGVRLCFKSFFYLILTTLATSLAKARTFAKEDEFEIMTYFFEIYFQFTKKRRK